MRPRSIASVAFAAVVLTLAFTSACESPPAAQTRADYEGCTGTDGTRCASGRTACETSPISQPTGSFGSTASWCTAACVVPSDCPAVPGYDVDCVAFASVEIHDVGKLCVIRCDLDKTVCPTDTTCESVEPADGGQDPHFCLP